MAISTKRSAGSSAASSRMSLEVWRSFSARGRTPASTAVNLLLNLPCRSAGSSSPVIPKSPKVEAGLRAANGVGLAGGVARAACLIEGDDEFSGGAASSPVGASSEEEEADGARRSSLGSCADGSSLSSALVLPPVSERGIVGAEASTFAVALSGCPHCGQKRAYSRIVAPHSRHLLAISGWDIDKVMSDE